MSNFNNHEYTTLVTDLIGDVFYTDTSYRGKISTIRQYAEVVVRKILDLEPDKKIMLGQNDIKRRIQALPNHIFLETAIKNIKDKGNDSTHTEYIENVSKEEFDCIVDSLLDILSFLLIEYFEKYQFGSRNDILTSFSLLPPIIRYKVLDFLNRKYPDNVAVIDKLVLSMMKAFSVEKAKIWVKENKASLTQLATITPKVYNEMIQNLGVEIALVVSATNPPNMYESCMRKIAQLEDTINKGVVYSDFESALPYYRENGPILDNTLEAKEFNDIMEFLYLGRKEAIKEFSSQKPFVVLNCIL